MSKKRRTTERDPDSENRPISDLDNVAVSPEFVPVQADDEASSSVYARQYFDFLPNLKNKYSGKQ